MNQALHSVTHFRLSVRDISWRPASSVLARRLLAEAVTNFPVNENKIAVIGGKIIYFCLLNSKTFKSWLQVQILLKSTLIHHGMIHGEKLFGVVWK